MIVIILGGSLNLYAQGVEGPGKKKKKAESNQSQSQPSSLEPYYPSKNYEPDKKKRDTRSERKITYDARDKFYDRMEQLAKQERKHEKEMAKPQNSDPMYFGHKRPPKKRPPEKMKFCKVCGIRH